MEGAAMAEPTGKVVIAPEGRLHLIDEADGDGLRIAGARPAREGGEAKARVNYAASPDLVAVLAGRLALGRSASPV